MTDLAGLPPAYITVGSQEIFLDEDLEYALRLARERPRRGAHLPARLP
jgi:hypothetical protein